MLMEDGHVFNVEGRDAAFDKALPGGAQATV